MEIGIAMIYARALYGAADDIGRVEEVKDEITQLDKIFKDEREFNRLMLNPAISNASKKKMIKDILGDKVLEEVLSFICILIDKGRLYDYHDIVRQYRNIVDEETGVGEGIVYSATELSDSQLKKFEDEASKLLRKKVLLKSKIDTSILGGVKIFVDGKIVDASLKTKLDKLAEQIKNS